MSRYIDADALVSLWKPLADRDCFVGNVVASCLNELNAQPTVDAVLVVRCGDCKCWDLEHISCEGYARCLTGESGVRYRKENDFCSCGERRSSEP